ncbi:MAG: glycoside hydrolase family 1 protein [Candidatus Omnitrophica bacterium]|nr:glycoside hydrolase family 1 protein [Candidatus Omnitrophota bacterium]
MKTKISFPDNFLWGSATSSHQVEGDNRNNDWWSWETEGRVKEPSGKACNQYELFKNDFKLARSLNHNAHRFSLEWSRIEPEEGKFDLQAIEHYREMLKNLRSLGITPIVTINHFTLPMWFYKKGGWIGKRGGQEFASYAAKVAEKLGEHITYWLTVNEPVSNIYSAYITGSWPPGDKSMKQAGKVFVAILKAHCLAYKAIHRVYKKKGWVKPKVSFAKFTLVYAPCRPKSINDKLASLLRHYYVNKLFIASLMKGRCLAPGMPPTILPARRSLDFIGLNYYTRDYVHLDKLLDLNTFGYVCSVLHHKDSAKRNFLGWEIYPKGLYDMLMDFSKYKLPILITENGICTSNDNDRIDFLKDHLKEVAQAIKDGADIFGYLHWSLIDNFEWAHGYGPRFGLVDVDYASQRRTVKPSARILADIIKNNAV